jgi:hypothetical protein
MAPDFHAARRRLAELFPEAGAYDGGGVLELATRYVQEKPRLDPPEPLEDKALRAHPVAGPPVARFCAFLDGTQTSRVARYVGGTPLVHATVAAVVRERRERRLTTWRPPLVRRALYAPLSRLSDSFRSALEDSGIDIVDTSARRDVDSIHPFALQDAALEAVQRDRSALERELAEAWCTEGDGILFVDGGISDSAVVARSASVVGVVKSHQQLYVHGDDLHHILNLPAGARSSVTRVVPRGRTPVASWYLRLRSTAGHDPLWGLVRVEVAEPKGSARTAIGRYADDVSRWVLAESLPLALPDARWDKMVYGIRDCEEFLRAIQ